MKRLSSKRLFLIAFIGLLTLFFFSSIAKGRAYNINDDIILDMTVNGVSLDDAVSGQGAFPIGNDYTIDFEGDVHALKGLTINYLEFVIKEAGFDIHQPVRINELSGVHFPAGMSVNIHDSYVLPDEIKTIINQIRGTHELEVDLSYTLDGQSTPKQFVEETNIVIPSEGFVDTITTASGAGTMALSAGAAVATVGTASTVISSFSYLSGKFFDDLKNLWKGIKTTKEVAKAVKKGIPLRAKVRPSGLLSSFMSNIKPPTTALDGGEKKGDMETITLSSKEVSEKEAFLKGLLRDLWDQKKCPKCGAKWNKKKEVCPRSNCAISLAEAQDVWVERMWPFLVKLADLILVKKMKLKKARKKLKVDKQKLTKKTVRQLAAILVQGHLIDVDWKSVVPLGRLMRSGLFIGASIFLWLFLYGVTKVTPQSLIISISVSILVPLIIGLILRNSINKKQKLLMATDSVSPEIETTSS